MLVLLLSWKVNYSSAHVLQMHLQDPILLLRSAVIRLLVMVWEINNLGHLFNKPHFCKRLVICGSFETRHLF